MKKRIKLQLLNMAANVCVDIAEGNANAYDGKLRKAEIILRDVMREIQESENDG